MKKMGFLVLGVLFALFLNSFGEKAFA